MYQTQRVSLRENLVQLLQQRNAYMTVVYHNGRFYFFSQKLGYLDANTKEEREESINHHLEAYKGVVSSKSPVIEGCFG